MRKAEQNKKTSYLFKINKLFVTLAVIIAVVGALKGLYRHKDRLGLPSLYASGDSGLSCAHLSDVAEQLQSEHAVSLPDFSARRFSNDFAAQLIRRLDPQGLLFDQQDLKRLQEISASAWKNALKKGECEGFANWIATEYPRARARFFARYQRLRLNLNKVKKVETLPELPKIAKSDAVLTKRLVEFIGYWMNKSTPELLRAFSNDPNKYMDHTFSTLFDLQEEPVAELLAKALLKSTDRYSTYLSEDEFEDFFDDLSGGTSGIGIKVRKVPLGLMVEDIVKKSPAGISKEIKSGDIIVAVDNQSVVNLSTKSSKKLLKGAEGSTVALKLRRLGKKHDIDFSVSLTREKFDFSDSKVRLQVARARTRSSKVSILTIPSFYGPGGPDSVEGSSNSVSEDVRTQLEGLDSETEALVLDLRDNPGGYLEEAIHLAGFFLGDKPIVGVKERSSKRLLSDRFQKALYRGPLVVMLNEESASAAEVLAGALKDHGRALLVGASHTFGKGSVQKFFPIKNTRDQITADQGVLKITTSLFYSPLGHCPNNGGIRPHISLYDAKETVDSESPWKSDDLKPFVAREEIRRMKKANLRIEKQAFRLNRRSKSRCSKTSHSIASADDKDKLQLAETVEIAADYAVMQQGMTIRNTTRHRSRKDG